jgi:hypothetical protein
VLRRAIPPGLSCLLLLLACAARAEACSCAGPGSACAAFGSAAAVFVGTVTDIRTRPHDATGQEDAFSPRTVTFLVEEAFSGVDGAAAYVSTGRGGGDCGYKFERGVSYLVYAFRGKESRPLSTGICTRTRPAARASEDIEFLRAQARQPSGVTVSGKVGRPLAVWDEDNEALKLDPLEGVRVTVSGRGWAREARTDAQGRYKLAGLPPGPQEVEVHLPDELIAERPKRSFHVADRGCASADFLVLDNGRLKGRVLDAEGRPVPDVTLTLLEAEGKKPESQYGRGAKADAGGRFKYEGLPAGRYLLGVRIVPQAAADDPAAAFPRTYYPGVAGAAEAEVLEVKTGEELTLGDLLLPPRLAEGVVRGRVVWDDGTPVGNAEVYYRETTYGDASVDSLTRADAQGQFEVRSRVGAVLRLRAATTARLKSDPPDSRWPVSSETETLSVAGPAEAVTLVIPRLK